MLTKFLDEKDYPSIGTHGCKARCPLDVEVWEDLADVPVIIARIHNFPRGIYFVSNFGRIMSKQRDPIIFLKGSCPRNKYVRVTLYINGVSICVTVHRVVFSAFGVCPNRIANVIDHIDTDTKNNYISNLEMVTQRENMRNPLTILKKSKKGRVHGKVNIIFPDTKEVYMEFHSVKDALREIGLYEGNPNRNLMYGCLALEINGELSFTYNPFSCKAERYYYINNDTTKIFNKKSIPTYVYKKHSKEFKNLHNGEKMSILIERGKNKFLTSFYRLTCKEMWWQVKKKEADNNKSIIATNQTTIDTEKDILDYYRSCISDNYFLGYIKENSDIIKKFEEFRLMKYSGTE